MENYKIEKYTTLNNFGKKRIGFQIEKDSKLFTRIEKAQNAKQYFSVHTDFVDRTKLIKSFLESKLKIKIAF